MGYSFTFSFPCCATAWTGQDRMHLGSWMALVTGRNPIPRMCCLDLHLLAGHACLFPHPMHSASALGVGVGLSPGLQVGWSWESARRLLLMEAATSPALGLTLGSERLHMPKENWRSHAVGAVRFMGRKEKVTFMLCACSYILVKWATVPPESDIWNSESLGAVSCCRLACECPSHFSIQKSWAKFVIKVACEKLLQISLPVWRASGFASLPSQMVVELQDLRLYSILQLTKALNPLNADFAWRHGSSIATPWTVTGNSTVTRVQEIYPGCTWSFRFRHCLDLGRPLPMNGWTPLWWPMIV